MGDVGSFPGRYRLSFTAGGLFADAAPKVAELYLRAADATIEPPGGTDSNNATTSETWAAVRSQAEHDNLLQARTQASNKRLTREVAFRLATLSDAELAMLVDATSTERGHLLWVAACRQYEFVGDFAQEVLRERFLLMRPAISHDDFDDFVAAKAMWHEELSGLKPSTIVKVRATLFRMMREAGLITDDGTLNRVVLSHRVADAFAARTPSDERFFPTVGAAVGGG